MENGVIEAEGGERGEILVVGRMLTRENRELDPKRKCTRGGERRADIEESPGLYAGIKTSFI